jgi:hypothetical protein
MDAKCIQCGGDSGYSKRNGKPLKYCSQKCSNKFYHSREAKKNPNYGNPNWKNKTKLLKEKQAKKREEFEWYKENWFAADQLYIQLGLKNRSSVFHRAKIAGVKPKKIHAGASGTHCFFNPIDIPKLRLENIPKKETPIPEGYILTKEAMVYLGVTHSTLWTYDIPTLKQAYNGANTRNLYKIEDLDVWRAERALEEQQRAVERTKKAELRALEEKQRRNKLLEQVKGYVPREEAAVFLGLKTINAPIHAQLEKYKKVLGRVYYEPSELEALRRQREEEKILKEKNRKKRLFHREDDWTSHENYEKKIFSVNIPRDQERFSNAKNWTTVEKSIKSNLKYRKLHNLGHVAKLQCKKCFIDKPYYDFYYEATVVSGRALNLCKICHRQVSNRRDGTAYNKKRFLNNPAAKLRHAFGSTIKQDVTNNRQEFAKNVGIRLVWEKIKEHCGYDENQLKEHLENRFEDWMDWTNHGQINKNKKTWNIDHIKPRSAFNYTSLDDPEFKQCWDLNNIRPLCAVENVAKGNSEVNLPTTSQNDNVL